MMRRTTTAAAIAALSFMIAAGVPAVAQAQEVEDSPIAQTEASKELARELGIEGLTPSEVKAELESQGFSAGADGKYAKGLGSGITLKVASTSSADGSDSTPTGGEFSAQGVGIRFDPLPYLIGTGKDWTELSKGGAVAVAAAVCSPAGLVAGACGAVTNMILDGFGDPENLPNAKDCYVMKNFNLPPEKVARSECG